MSDLIRRADAIKTIHRYKHRLEGRGQTYGFLLEEFENRIPSAQTDGDLISRTDAIEEFKKAYWDKNIQSAKDDPCVIDAMTDWAIRTIKALPSADAVSREVYEKRTQTDERIIDSYRREFAEVAEVASAEAVQGWIPCSERLPKKNEYVGNVCKYYLIQDEYGDMHVAHLSSRGWETIESIKALGCDVIAWMLLPKPYKGGAE